MIERRDFVDVNGVLGRVYHFSALPAADDDVLADGLAVSSLLLLIDALPALHFGLLRVAEGAVELREVAAYCFGHSGNNLK